MKHALPFLPLFLCTALLAVTTTGPAPAQDTGTIEKQVIEGTNRFRRTQGRKPLSTNAILMRTAKKFACYMARTGQYGHRADGRQPQQRATAQGFPPKGCVGENIAWNTYNRSRQASLLTNGWINSPPHRKNMLTLGAKITGVGVCGQGNRFYAVQLVGRAHRASLEIINRTPYPVHYSYRSGKGAARTGLVPGHANGWRSLTLNTCEHATLTATQTRPGRNGTPSTIRKSAMIGDRKSRIVFD